MMFLLSIFECFFVFLNFITVIIGFKSRIR